MHLLSAFIVSISFQLLWSLLSQRTQGETTGPSSDIATKSRKMREVGRNQDINKNKKSFIQQNRDTKELEDSF